MCWTYPNPEFTRKVPLDAAKTSEHWKIKCSNPWKCPGAKEVYFLLFQVLRTFLRFYVTPRNEQHRTSNVGLPLYDGSLCVAWHLLWWMTAHFKNENREVELAEWVNTIFAFSYCTVLWASPVKRAWFYCLFTRYMGNYSILRPVFLMEGLILSINGTFLSFFLLFFTLFILSLFQCSFTRKAAFYDFRALIPFPAFSVDALTISVISGCTCYKIIEEDTASKRETTKPLSEVANCDIAGVVLS